MFVAVYTPSYLISKRYFIPLTNIQSLFGMNIDILSGGPNWSWYPIFCVPVLVLVIFTWLVCKYIEVYIASRSL